MASPKPNTVMLNMMLGLIPVSLQEMFDAGNASVVPIAFNEALHRKHDCRPKECYSNVRKIFLEAKQNEKKKGEEGQEDYIVCIGYGCVDGVWLEHCWLLDPATQERVDVTTDSFSHVYGVPVPSSAHILAAQPLHMYASIKPEF